MGDAEDALDAFRLRLREWLARTAPIHGWDRPAPMDESDASRLERARTCQKELVAAGFAGITWPKQYGGLGLGTREQLVFDQESARYQLPLTPWVITLGICGPAMLAMGTDAQKDRYLRPLLNADEMWCQLFSEPGAGSDVASLSTRATRVDGGWSITGQKVWTSGAKNCAFGLLLARSNPELPKHRGLTMFVLDMKAAGIEVRPLKQMNGHSRFNEVFFDEVFVRDEDVVGAVDEGWRAATATLMTERVSIGSGTAGRDAHEASALIAAARATGVASAPTVRLALVRAWERERLADLLGERVAAQVLAGRVPGPEGSLIKWAGTQRSMAAAYLGVELHGIGGVAWDPAVPADERWTQVALSAPGLALGGGTTEIQKNIIAERVLGLPRDPQPK
jgi:alkylation response protein AidB-like acyl-CoA dehydrogenase